MTIVTSKNGFSLENGLLSYDRFEIRLHGVLVAYYDATHHQYKVVAEWINAECVELMLQFINENTRSIDDFIREHEYDIWSTEPISREVPSLSVGRWTAVRRENTIEILYDQKLFGRFDEDSKKLENLNKDTEISFGEWLDFQRLHEYLYNFQLS